VHIDALVDYFRIKSIIDEDNPCPKEHSKLFKPLVLIKGTKRTCKLCGYTIANSTQMTQHLREEYRLYPYKCQKPKW
jgi:hypothetical protein